MCNPRPSLINYQSIVVQENVTTIIKKKSKTNQMTWHQDRYVLL